MIPLKIALVQQPLFRFSRQRTIKLILTIFQTHVLENTKSQCSETEAYKIVTESIKYFHYYCTFIEKSSQVFKELKYFDFDYIWAVEIQFRLQHKFWVTKFYSMSHKYENIYVLPCFKYLKRPNTVHWCGSYCFLSMTTRGSTLNSAIVISTASQIGLSFWPWHKILLIIGPKFFDQILTFSETHVFIILDFY